jgi:hypothetical protein
VKLEFLDISLNTWSMIVFFFYALFLISMTLAVFGGRGNRSLFLFIILTFITFNTVLVLYGIETSQVGFILMVIFQLFLTTLTFIYLNGNIPTLENEDFLNEDR